MRPQGLWPATRTKTVIPGDRGGSPYIDISTGMLNTFSAVSALYSRTKTGEGQKIETCLFNTGMALLATGFAKIEEIDRERHQKELDFLSTAFREGKTHTQIIDTISEIRLRQEQPESIRPLDLPDCNHRPADRYAFPYYRIYETANGFIGVAALTSKQRKNMFEVVGVHDKTAGVEFGDMTDDIHYHQQEMTIQLEKRLREKTNNEWIEALEKAGIPCGPVNYTANPFYDPQVKAMDMIWDLHNSELGPYKMVGHPVRYPKDPVKPGKGAPTLGEDTVSVLEQFGYNKIEIEALKKQAVIK